MVSSGKLKDFRQDRSQLLSYAAPMNIASTVVGSTQAISMPSGQIANLAASPDANLLLLAKTGCPCAFAELARRHRALVSAMVFRIVRNSEDTEDLVQESFLKALRHIDGFDGRAKFSTWLTKIAVNSSLMRLR